MEDENFRKIFVGGLHHTTTNEGLKKFYEQWGEVVDCIVMHDPVTKRSRGFGFVTFAESSSIDECLKARPHKIEEKVVECKRAIPREGMAQALPELHVTSNKLFVGSLKDEMQEEHLREYFSQFGAISTIVIATEKGTGKRRGFAFVTFEDYDPVDKVILMGEHEICGSKVAVKKAIEREQKELIASGGAVRGGRGRGGRGAPGRGGRGRGGAGPPGGYYDGNGYGAPAGGYGGGYGADGYGGGYSDGWNQGGGAAGGYGGWQQGGPGPAAGGWNQGYGDAGYGQGAGGAAGGNFGSGYGAGYGGGAMKGPGYNQRAPGPYGGGYGRGGAAAGPYGGPAPYGGPGYGGR